MTRKTAISTIIVLASLSCSGQTKPTIRQHAKNSACSNIVALAGNVNINCSSLTPEQRKLINGIPDVLRKLLANQIDPKAVLVALDQIKADVSGVRTLIPVTQGELIPADDADPHVECPSPIKPDALILSLGSHASVIDATRSETDAIVLAGKPIVSFKRSKSGTLLITATVRSPDGKIIAQIQSGVFYVNPNNSFRIDRPDKSTLTVYDEEGSVALHVRYMNKRTVYLTGYFIDSNRKLVVNDDEITAAGFHFSGGCDMDSRVGFSLQ
jgi:hypothetical protein